jgi:hypothetical protein
LARFDEVPVASVMNFPIVIIIIIIICLPLQLIAIVAVIAVKSGNFRETLPDAISYRVIRRADDLQGGAELVLRRVDDGLEFGVW